MNDEWRTLTVPAPFIIHHSAFITVPLPKRGEIYSPTAASKNSNTYHNATA